MLGFPCIRAFPARSAQLLIALCVALSIAACTSEPKGTVPSPSGEDDGDEPDDDSSEDGEKPSSTGKTDSGPVVKRDAGGKLDAGTDASSVVASDASQASGDAGHASMDRMDASVAPDADAGRLDAGTPTATVTGCPGTTLLPLNEDLKARGPWEVGVRTVQIGRLTAEAFYPAQPGSTAGMPEATWNLTSFLPKREQEKVPVDHAPPAGVLGGHAYRDVPLDGEHGPYPVVLFIHGTASFRVGSASTNAHWASRGIVVLAADYPGLGLSDQLSSTLACGLPTSGRQDLPGDVMLQLNALKAPSGDLSFLAKHVDATRVGISGHSQGACIAATLSTDPGIRIVLPLDGATSAARSSTLESVIYVSGMADKVIGYDSLLIGSSVCPLGSVSSKSAYNGSPGPPRVKKRLVGIKGGGHLVPTDLCRPNAQGKTGTKEAQDDGVCGVSSAAGVGLNALSDCGTIDWKVGVEAVNYATAAALEETLLCQDRSKQFAALKTNLPQVGEFLESVK